MDTFYLVLADALLINTSLEGDDAISDFLLSDKCKKIVKIGQFPSEEEIDKDVLAGVVTSPEVVALRGGPGTLAASIISEDDLLELTA